MIRSLFVRAAASIVTAALAAAVAAQEIRIGLTGTFTGPNASVGIPYRNAAEIFPPTMGGVPVKWIVLDDGGDPTAALKNARRFVDEDKVDAIVGSTSTPTATALFDVANDSKTLQIAMAPVAIPAAKSAWLFNIPQPVPLMVSAIVEDMKRRGVKSAAYIGYADGWGDLNWNAFNKLATDAGIKVLAAERFNRTDTSVTAQALKVFAAAPDALFVGAAGTPAVLPHVSIRDLGFKGPVYHTHGAVAGAVIQAGGKAIEGALMPTGPMVVTADLPESNPIRKVSTDFIARYQAKWGPGAVAPFAGYAWDAQLLLDAAATRAIKSGAKPGTPQFREALRNAMISGTEVVGTNAVYKYSEADRYGVDERARVLVTVKDGAFRLFRP
ncbi:MAG: ABC transporter substrate-binding protein [Burkholderiaceae bacterium]|jgi:branched-chain amino acid transport system substrate-binding protein|nr:ABC transporter substrate-binding protein [Burkholderiales bacterium]MCZ8105496.1 ABC transporter substrate-binding protein [Burkholderiales bacterium]MCZ8340095.1 ABC transporter substrate-binding protein [Burkholderiaceae bacterium]